VHILAISGMNIGMVAFGVFLILNLLPISRRWQMALTIVIIAFYSFMAGGNSPVVRAAVTGTVFLLGYLFEREQDMLNSLAFAALCILLFLPNQIFDVGFQLSFGSVLAIILFTPLIMRPVDQVRIIAENRLWRAIAEALAVSLAAILGVSGMIAYYFQIVTPVALIANLPVIPLVGIATAIGGGLLVFGLLVPPVAPLFAVCAKVTLNLMVLILYVFGLIPGGSFYVPLISFGQVLIYYVVVMGLYIGVRFLVHNQARIWLAWQLGL
jgi:competence protein ComEC